MSLGLATHKNDVVQFLKERHARIALGALLQRIAQREGFGRKEGFTIAEKPDYEKAVDSLVLAIREGWTNDAEILETFDYIEVAGRHHVLLYQLPAGASAADFMRRLGRMAGTITGVQSLDDFVRSPDDSYARIVRSDAEEFIAKIVSTRVFFLAEDVPDALDTALRRERRDLTADDYELLLRVRHTQRSVMVVKFNAANSILQIRISPIHGSNDATPKKTFEYASGLIARHLTSNFLNSLQLFPLLNCFQPIVGNRTDFMMKKDNPSGRGIKASISNEVEAGQEETDLRDRPEWQVYRNGYNRHSLSGLWEFPAEATRIRCNMHYDEISLRAGELIGISRLFFPVRCSDDAIDFVIQRILSHLPRTAQQRTRSAR